MKTALVAVSVALVALPALPATASDEGLALQLKPKSAIAIAAPHGSAPYVQPLGEPQREPLFAPRDSRHEQSRSSCESVRDLCYDQGSGRIVYKPARQFMPGLPGLAADSISLKRDRLVLKYTF